MICDKCTKKDHCENLNNIEEGWEYTGCNHFERDEGMICNKCEHKDVCKDYGIYGEHLYKCVNFLGIKRSDVLTAVEYKNLQRIMEQGKWLHLELIPNDITGHMHGECSNCHKVRIIDNYCPNCGTKMQIVDGLGDFIRKEIEK